MSFFDVSREVVEKFLQTVVVVDDEAHLRGCIEKTSALQEEIAQLKLKITELTQAEEIKKGVRTSKQKIVTPGGDNFEEKNHQLDAKLLGDIFASKGFVCSVLRPQMGDNPIEESIAAIRCSDVIILDWVLNQDHGARIKNLISKIIASDRDNGGRLRLILIYTGETDLFDIRDQIKEKLNDDYKGIEIQEDELVLQVNSFCKISIYAKENSKTPLDSRKKLIKDLPQCIVDEFTSMTSGLMTNVALNSLSVLRSNTHRLLKTIHSGIDIPYLAHRALLPEPDDASDHAVEIIASEIKSLLETYDAGEYADFNHISKWIEQTAEYHLAVTPEFVKPNFEFIAKDAITQIKKKTLEKAELKWLTQVFEQRYVSNKNKFEIKKYPFRSLTINQEDVKSLLKNGIDEWKIPEIEENDQGIVKETIHKSISSLFIASGDDFSKLDHEFAKLTLLSASCDNSVHISPKLTLGTIVVKKDTHNYYICLQPRCDSVRIENDEAFPLLPLRKVGHKGKLHYAVTDTDGTNIYLEINYKPNKIEMITFHKPLEEDKGVIRAKKSEGKYVFSGVDNDYYWLGNLKPEQAQRLVNNFTSNMARVGLNESEWLRRVAT